MDFVEKFFNWVIALFVSIPGDMITTILASFFVGLIIKAIRKIKKTNTVLINRLLILKKVIGDISPEEEFIITPSPQYPRNRKKAKKNSNSSTSSDDMYAYLIIMVIITIWILTFLKEHVLAIQLVIGIISCILMSLPILIFVISAFYNRIQSSSIKFCFFSFGISLFTYYNSLLLPGLVSKIPDNIKIFYVFENTNGFLNNLYMFFGLLILLVEIFMNLMLFLRMVMVKIDSLKSYRSTRFIISHTALLEKISFLVFLFVCLTLLSFLFTSGIAYNFITSF